MKEKNSKIFNIFLNGFFYVLFVLMAILLVFVISSKKNSDEAVKIFNYEMRIVISPSMEKCEQTDVSQFEIKDIPLKSLVFIETVPEDKKEAYNWYKNLRENDVLTFKYVYSTQETITHRIKQIDENERGGFTILLAGDNKNSDTDTLEQIIDTSYTDSPNYVIGKVVKVSYVLGIVISSLKSPIGIILMIIVPCLIIMILEIIRLVGLINGNHKELEKRRNDAKDNEIEQLKRRLAELEKKEGKGE